MIDIEEHRVGIGRPRDARTVKRRWHIDEAKASIQRTLSTMPDEKMFFTSKPG
jgi:hypothetical protein